MSSNVDKFVLFPGPFLYITEVNNHSEIKESIVSFIKNHATTLDEIDCPHEKAFSSYYAKDNLFREFLNINGFIDHIVWNPLDNMIEQMPYEKDHVLTQSNLKQIWYQYYKTSGGHHKEHTHGGSTFSGIYILHSTEPNKTIFFGNGPANQTYQKFRHDTHYLSEGHVIIFPSELYHRVLPNDHERMVISFNIQSF